MSFKDGKEYSLLAVSICKTREERANEEKILRRHNHGAGALAKKMAKKITSLLRLRFACFSRRQSKALVFNHSSYSDFEEYSQCKYSQTDRSGFVQILGSLQETTSELTRFQTFK